MSAPPAGTSPRVSALLLTQFFDGFGGRFHGLLLSLYALQVGGVRGFAGLTSAALVGSALSVLAAGWFTSRLGGAGAMRVAGAALGVARLASYVVLPLGLPLGVLIGLRLVGASAGTLIATSARAQVPRDDRASVSLAWMGVCNGAGQALAAVGAAALSFTSPLLVAGLGAPIAVGAMLPTLRLARYASATPVPWREQLDGLRSALRPVVLGVSVFAVLNVLPGLSDGLVTERYAGMWLGPMTAVAFVGALSGAAALPLLRRLGAPSSADVLLWPGLAAVGVVGWAMFDRGVVWMLTARFAAAAVAQIVAALSEARVLAAVGGHRGTPALAASAALAAVGTAATTAVAPALLEAFGLPTVSAAATLWLLAVATAGTLVDRYLPRSLRRAGTAPSPATA